MRRTFTAALCLMAMAQVPVALASPDCSGNPVPQPLPLRPTLLAPVAPEFQSLTTQLGAPSGVLAQGYDEALSVDHVLLRLRVEGCQPLAKALPPGVLDPNNPAAYKPQTEFDNTPWRFDMSQGGKRMTAEEFDAWMKARGVRVVKARAPAPAAPVEPVVEAAAEGEAR